MLTDELKKVVHEEIAKAKLAGEDVSECEIRLIEALKTKTLPDERRPTIMAEAVEMLWTEWEDD